MLLHMSLSHIAAWWRGSKKEGREQKQPGLFRIELRSSLPPYSTGQSSHRASSGSRGGEVDSTLFWLICGQKNRTAKSSCGHQTPQYAFWSQQFMSLPQTSYANSCKDPPKFHPISSNISWKFRISLVGLDPLTHETLGIWFFYCSSSNIIYLRLKSFELNDNYLCPPHLSCNHHCIQLLQNPKSLGRRCYNPRAESRVTSPKGQNRKGPL